MAEGAPPTPFFKKGVFSTVFVVLGLSFINVQPGTEAAAQKKLLKIPNVTETYHTLKSQKTLKMGSDRFQRTAAKEGLQTVARKSAVSEILRANQGLNGLNMDSYTSTVIGDPQVSKCCGQNNYCPETK